MRHCVGKPGGGGSGGGAWSRRAPRLSRADRQRIVVGPDESGQGAPDNERRGFVPMAACAPRGRHSNSSGTLQLATPSSTKSQFIPSADAPQRGPCLASQQRPGPPAVPVGSPRADPWSCSSTRRWVWRETPSRRSVPTVQDRTRSHPTRCLRSDQTRRQRRPWRPALTTPTKGIPRSSRKVPRTAAGYRPLIRLGLRETAFLFKAFSTSSRPRGRQRGGAASLVGHSPARSL